jgi:lipopolysaccharide export system protein LptC
MNNEVHYTDPSRQSPLPDVDEETTSTSDYVQNLQPIKDQKRKSKRRWTVVLVILLLVAIGAGVYFFVPKPKPTPAPASETPQQQTEQVPRTTETETYTSDELKLSFQHLTSWAVDDQTDGLIKVSSPVVKLKDATNQEVDAKVVVTFMSAGSEVPLYENSQGLAALMDSEKITYDAPTQTQRGQTYISFGGLTPAGLDAVFVTGNSGYKKGQMIPEADIKKVEPIISVMFYSCDDAACEGGDEEKSISVALSEWEQNETLQSAQKLLQSLKVM